MTERSDDEVRERAYALWESEGKPDGKHEEHWTRASQDSPSEAAAPALQDQKQKPATGSSKVRRRKADLPPATALGNEGSTD